jgi:hypothetical protein
MNLFFDVEGQKNLTQEQQLSLIKLSKKTKILGSSINFKQMKMVGIKASLNNQ